MEEKIYEARAEIARALAHATRLKIIDLLKAEGEYCVCDLTEELEVSQSTVSKHLRVLKDSGLVNSRKEGLQVYYNLRAPCVGNFFSCLDQVLKNNLKDRQEELGF